MASDEPEREERDKPPPVSGQTRSMLAVAAESLVKTPGLEATVVDVVHGRALRHYHEALRQYLAIRLGGVERAGTAMAELRATVAAMESEELLEVPGIRGRLFRLAREIADRRREASGTPSADDRDALPWRGVRYDTRLPPDAVRRMRHDVGEADAELLELRFARDLSPAELAFVLGVPEDEIGDRLEEALARARERLGEHAEVTDETLQDVLLEAFSLVQQTASAGGGAGAGDGAERAQGGWEPLPERTVVGGRYAIEKRVGSGSFGDVYRAQDTEVPGHVVALKLLHQTSRSEEAKSAALRELHLIASVFHPSVVQFKDHGWHEGRLWFVMPWYEGETLEARIQRKPLSRPEARRIFEPLARALESMHAVGIRHQDVKPENIFLARIQGFRAADDDEEVLPVLIDLGVAAKEAEMVIAGTPNYFAPEVASQFARPGEGPAVGSPADIFALALSLRNALEPETQEEVMGGAVDAFIERRAREMPELPESKELRFLDPWLRQWMSLDPQERPTADQLAEELAVLTRPEERRDRVVKLMRWLGPLAVTVVVVFASVVYALDQRAEREKLEAQRAKMTAADLRENLELTREQREKLEEDVEGVRTQYEESKMTRQDLAKQLAETEGELDVVKRRFAAAVRRAHDLEHDLDETKDELETTQRKLKDTESKLSSARERIASLEGSLSDVRKELEKSEREAEKAQKRIASLETERSELQSDLDSERSRRADVEKELARAKRARDTAQRKLERAERRISELEADVARLKRELRKAKAPRTPARRVTPEEESSSESGPGSAD